MNPTPPPDPILTDGVAAIRADAAHAAERGRWGQALMIVGWVHLLAFLACHAIRDPAVQSNPWHAVLWMLDAAGSLAVLRAIAGPRWYRASPATALIARIWGTFLILAFNLAVLNTASGWDHDWFKPTWCVLSSFGFATMAWLFGAGFLLPALLMWGTGLLMVRYPGWNYVIFGVSWWLALQALGGVLIRSRDRRLRGRVGST